MNVLTLFESQRTVLAGASIRFDIQPPAAPLGKDRYCQKGILFELLRSRGSGKNGGTGFSTDDAIFYLPTYEALGPLSTRQ